jgi:hypothetical protein
VVPLQHVSHETGPLLGPASSLSQVATHRPGDHPPAHGKCASPPTLERTATQSHPADLDSASAPPPDPSVRGYPASAPRSSPCFLPPAGSQEGGNFRGHRGTISGSMTPRKVAEARRREAGGKAPVGIARSRAGVLTPARRTSRARRGGGEDLAPFVRGAIDPHQTTVRTDGFSGYRGLRQMGVRHRVRVQCDLRAFPALFMRTPYSRRSERCTSTWTVDIVEQTTREAAPSLSP